MDWSALKDLVAVAETGTLSGAARKLGVSQPTIGRRIEQLEIQLGATLFNRSPQGLALTPTGEQVLTYAERMSDEALAIERIASSDSELLEGTVRITLTDMLGTYWLPSKLPEFFTRYPGLKLEVAVENRNLDLVKREADIAIRFARPQQLDYVIKKSVDFHYGIYASKEYLLRNGSPKSFRDFKDHTFVSYDETILSGANLKRLEKMMGKENILIRSTNIANIVTCVKEGIGIGILACYCCDDDPGLERILRKQFDFYFPAWLVTHVDIQKSARIKAVFNFLDEQLQNDTDRFKGSSMNPGFKGD